jgi:hypothetical protein
MKKPLFLLICVLLLILAGASPALAHERTFVVHPSGGDDTATIQQAFAAAGAAGPGSTVQLTAGRFYMNNILVQGFRGRFVGAGMHRTMIDTLRGLDPSLPGVTLMDEPENPGVELTGWTFLIGFLSSDVRVSGMTFDITAAEPSEVWGEGPYAGQTNVSDILVFMRDSDSAVDRVGISAHAGDMNGYNIEGALVIADTGGTHTITRCCFSGNNGPEIVNLDGAKLTIGGSPAMGNRIDMYGACSFFNDLSHSIVEISHNRLRAFTGAGVWVSQTAAAPQPAPLYDIHDNGILAAQAAATDGSGGVWGAAGVMLEDDTWMDGVPSCLRAVVCHNRIALDNGGRAGGVDGLGAQGVRVMGNHISGTGIAGIDAGTDIYAAFGGPWNLPAPADGWRIIDNDVRDLHLLNDYGGPSAPIWLGTASTRCLVVGRGCKPTGVLDQGTDNILINASRLQWPPTAARAAAPRGALTHARASGPVNKF